MLEVLGETDLLLSHLLDPPHLHGLFLLELLLLHEGLLGLLLLLEKLSLSDSSLLVVNLLLLLLFKLLLLLECLLLLSLLLDELVGSSTGLGPSDGRVIHHPTVGLLLPLGEQLST